MNEQEYILQSLQSMESKYGYMNLQWKVSTYDGSNNHDGIAICSRPLSSEEREKIEINVENELVIDSLVGLSTCHSLTRMLMFKDQICIDCIYDNTVIISISLINDTIRRYTPPFLISKRMCGDTFFI